MSNFPDTPRPWKGLCEDLEHTEGSFADFVAFEMWATRFFERPCPTEEDCNERSEKGYSMCHDCETYKFWDEMDVLIRPEIYNLVWAALSGWQPPPRAGAR